MFIRHLLAAKPSELWVQKLAARYALFHTDDIVPLCVMCHEEMHRRYLPYIRAITYHTRFPIAAMGESQVSRYINELRKRCARIVRDGFPVRKGIQDAYNRDSNFRNARRT